MITFLVSIFGFLLLVFQSFFTNLKVIETNPFRVTNIGKLALSGLLVYSMVTSYSQCKTDSQFDGIEQRVNTTDLNVANIDSNVIQISTKVDRVDLKSDSMKLAYLQNTNHMLMMRNSIDSFKYVNFLLEKRIIEESNQRKRENRNLYTMFDSLKSGLNVQNKMVDIAQSSNLSLVNLTFEHDPKDSLQRELKYFITNTGRKAKIINSRCIILKTDKNFQIKKIITDSEMFIKNSIIPSGQDQMRWASTKISDEEVKGDFEIVVYSSILYQDEYNRETKNFEEVNHFDCSIKNSIIGNNPLIQKTVIDNLKIHKLIVATN